MNVPIPTVVQRTVLGLAESVMNSIIKITTADLKVCGMFCFLEMEQGIYLLYLMKGQINGRRRCNYVLKM